MPDELRIYARAVEQTREIAVCDGNRLLEFYREGENENSLENAILLGRVDRVLPAMKAAFVRIGLPQNGFLPLNEPESFRQTNEAPLRTDDEIIVQVKKDPKDDKGAFLTRDVTLVGETIIYMPLNRHIGVSKRVTGERERSMLVELGKELANGACGLILRDASLHARREEIAEELTALRERWESIQTKAKCQKAPATLYREPSAMTGLVRDYARRYDLRVTCSDAINRRPGALDGVLWEQAAALELDARWSSLRVEAQVREALGRRVELPNGGWLMIDEREALTTVDVNSGRYVGDRDEHQLALTQNLAACDEIARQIRLRNISGVIIIDFIDMRGDDERQQVTDALQAELVKERGKCVIHGFTSLGLLEMTRKRTRESLRGMLCEPCAACGGTGYRRSGSK